MMVVAVCEEVDDEGPLALDSAGVETTPMGEGKVRPCSPSNDGHLFWW